MNIWFFHFFFALLWLQISTLANSGRYIISRHTKSSTSLKLVTKWNLIAKICWKYFFPSYLCSLAIFLSFFTHSTYVIQMSAAVDVQTVDMEIIAHEILINLSFHSNANSQLKAEKKRVREIPSLVTSDDGAGGRRQRQWRRKSFFLTSNWEFKLSDSSGVIGWVAEFVFHWKTRERMQNFKV